MRVYVYDLVTYIIDSQGNIFSLIVDEKINGEKILHPISKNVIPDVVKKAFGI